MSSFFTVGDRYRDRYVVESVETFLDGELAVARTDENDRYYLQLTKLKRGTQSRVIQQYRSLDHPLVLPFAEVYTEERSIVFIRPYIALTRLDERLKTRPWDEEETIRLTKDLLQLEKMLNSRPLPMYLLLDPRNMGLTGDGELKVFFCGVRNYTALEPVVDWGTWMYMCMTGQIPEKPLAKLPPDRPFSDPMARLIEKSLKRASADQVLSQMETYERRKNSPGLLSRLFGGDNRQRKEKREESLRLPPGKSARPEPSALSKGKPLFGERAKPKLPFESAEGSVATKGASPSESHGLSTESRESFTTDKSPDVQRRAEASKVPPALEVSEQTEKSGLNQVISPREEAIEAEVPGRDQGDLKEGTSVPSAEIGRKTASPQDGTAATQKEDAPRVGDIQRPALGKATEKEEEAQRVAEGSPVEEEKPSEAVSRPRMEDGPPSPERSLAGAPSDHQTLQNRVRKPMDSLTRERLIRERRAHDRLAGQFRAYAKTVQSGGGS